MVSTKSLPLSMDTLTDSELSYYALNITSLGELEVMRKESIKTLRVMHCDQLTSLLGADSFPNLLELNCSSNQISEIKNLFYLKRLITLNLSCNDISSVPDLSPLISLEVLNLSHNRVTQLAGFALVVFFHKE